MIEVRAAVAVLIQDGGRHGYAHVGVPTSGAFDAHAFTLLCQLLDQATTSPVFEILAGPLRVRLSRDAVAAVLGSASVHVEHASVGTGHTFLIRAGQNITVTPAPGHRGPVYLAIRGMTAPKTLGSAARDTLSGLGTPPVAPGATFELAPEPARSDLLGRFTTARPPRDPQVLRMIAGPHPLTDTTTTWSVDAVSRSGVRLTGPATRTGGAASLPSFPVIPGTVQLPPSGQPIILGPDCGVTGGYPVIGVLIDADLPTLSRLHPGDQITLSTVTAAEARAAAQKATGAVFDINDVA